MERKGIELQIENIDFYELLKEVIKALGSRLEGDQEIVLECEASEAIVRADRIHLSNMVINLIDNAVKYGGPQVIVKVSCRIDNGSILLCIEDNGPGIDKKYYKKIFDRFFRVPEKKISAIKGFGLGLNYVKYVVRAHGWKIELESQPGKGSKFIIKIS